MHKSYSKLLNTLSFSHLEFHIWKLYTFTNILTLILPSNNARLLITWIHSHLDFLMQRFHALENVSTVMLTYFNVFQNVFEEKAGIWNDSSPILLPINSTNVNSWSKYRQRRQRCYYLHMRLHILTINILIQLHHICVV